MGKDTRFIIKLSVLWFVPIIGAIAIALYMKSVSRETVPQTNHAFAQSSTAARDGSLYPNGQSFENSSTLPAWVRKKDKCRVLHANRHLFAAHLDNGVTVQVYELFSRCQNNDNPFTVTVQRCEIFENAHGVIIGETCNSPAYERNER